MIETSLQQTLAKEKLNYHPKQAICVLFHPREDKQQDFFLKKKNLKLVINNHSNR